MRLVSAFAGFVLLALTPVAVYGARLRQIGEGKRPKVLVQQGTVESTSGKMLGVEFYGGPPHGRQVDISSATFESADGKVVSPYPLHVGDKVIIISDPRQPTSRRPKPNGRMTPMFIQLLPIKALVVELIPTFRHGAPPGSDKG